MISHMNWLADHFEMLVIKRLRHKGLLANKSR